MASNKTFLLKVGATSFIAASLLIMPTSFAQSYSESELAGAPSMGSKESFEKSPIKAFHNSHRDRDTRHHRDNDHDQSARRHHREETRHDNRRYRNDSYSRHWAHADHNYNAHRDRNYRRTDNRSVHRRYNDGYRRHSYNRHRVNRPYWSYSHNSYPRNRRYYGSRHHGHHHSGYDHLYCPDHSGSRYHIGGYYNRSGSSVVISNYDRYGLNRPPRGHHWVRDHDRGDAILASVATGAIIGLVVGAIIADDDNDHRRYRHDRRHRY